MSKKDKVTLSIDIGGSKIVTALVGQDGVIHNKNRKSLEYPLTQSDLLTIISKLCHKTLEQYAKDDVNCIGVAIPGLADAAKGVWVYSSFSGIGDFHIAEQLKNEFKLPVYIDNDVNACALGEMQFGSCVNTKDFIWLTVSNGVGGSVVASGSLLQGAHGYSGEIGHINVVDNGYQCQCGNRGCTEAEAAGPAISRKFLERSGGNLKDNSDAKAIAEMARNGNTLAQEIFEEIGNLLGKAIGAAVNVLNPEKVVIGGGVSESFDLFYPHLKQTLDKTIFKAANRELVVEKTALGYDAALYGATAVALKNMEK